MKRLLLIAGIVVGLILAVPLIAAALVALNRLPASLARAMPFVETYVVEGDVRMTDGETRPDENVTVRIETSRGKKTSAKATPKNNYRYSATLMGFRPPVRDGDTIRITAAMKLSDANKAFTEPGEAKELLLADFERKAGEAAPTGTAGAEVFVDRTLRLIGGTPPASLDEWRNIPLTSLQNLPIQIDATVPILAKIQPMAKPEGDIPLKLELPDAPTREALRAIPLGDVGEELARIPFTWDKRRADIPFNYSLNAPRFVIARIVRAADGRPIRETRVGVPPDVGRGGANLTWTWDGKDDRGAFADIGDYLFVASANSLTLDMTPKGFIAEIAGETGSRVRYAQFTAMNTLGDFLDAFGLSVEERAARSGRSPFQFRETVSLHLARQNGGVQELAQSFRGTDTVGTFLTAFGLELDPVVREVEQKGVYRFVARGAEVKTRVPFESLRSTVAVASRDDFMRLPLSQLETLKDGAWVPLSDYLPLEFRLSRKTDEAALEDWQRPSKETARFAASPTNTLTDVIARFQQEPGVVATVRGNVEDFRNFDARIGVPNGAMARFYLGQQEPIAEDRMRADIRAAGVLVRALTDGLPDPLPGDGVTTVPIEATAIGLDQKPVEKDTITATATEGEFAANGRFARVGDVYQGTYTVPAAETDTRVRIDAASRLLGERNTALIASDKRAILFRTSVEVEVTPSSAPEVQTPTETPGAAPAESTAQTSPSPTPAAPTPTTPSSPTVAAPQTNGQTPPSGQPTDAAGEVRRIAKVYAQMKPETASRLILAMPTEQARDILLNMPERAAGAIVDAALSSDAEGADDPTVLQERKDSLLDILSSRRRRN